MAGKSVPSGINKIGNNYYQTIVVDSGNGAYSSTLYRTNQKGENKNPIGSSTGSGAYSINKGNATAEEQKLLADPNSQLRKTQTEQVKSTEKGFFPEGATAQQKQSLNKSSGGSGNQAQNPESQNNNNSNQVSEEKEKFAAENKDFKEGTRKEYSNIKYPRNLSSDNQDCIKFTIIEYKPSLASSSGSLGGAESESILLAGRPNKGQKILGSITLPIPAGIQDSNTVNWKNDEMNVIQQTLGMGAEAFIRGGPEAASTVLKDAERVVKESSNSGEAQKGIAGLLAALAVGKSGILQRTTGAVFNSNLELLFNSPSLRTFAFNFKLTPREPEEAKVIMKIIRFFKQSMAVKRSKTSLLLKTPHTFLISYLTSNKEHPYLNKFKECALTGFNVDYTPEGQYMTYMSSNIDERSMIAYQISLSFQELEPVFDDEYGNESPQDIKNIGY